MKLLFLGSLSANWMSGWQRCETLRQLVTEVVPFCQNTFLALGQPSCWRRLCDGFEFDEEAVAGFNREWLQKICACRPDVAWLEWPKLLRGETVAAARKRLPHCQFVAFFDDNPFGARTDEEWQWRIFFEAIPEYDLHFVKRPCDIAELQQRGARRAELFMHGYFEPLFHPADAAGMPSNEGGHNYDVTFVGTALDHRVPFIHQLMARERLPLIVFGHRWHRTLFYHFHRPHFRPAVLGKAYADVLRRSRVNLAFVSSSNRDEYTMRTFEIPACGGFMLAERTPAHQELFGEGEEVEFFSSVEECADKARFYIKNDAARQRVAQAGYDRCVEEDYSLKRRLRDALALIERPIHETTLHF